ncbi:MAG: hypothetical protein RLY45_156, partial [Actinomycetota bacterium]
RELDWTERSVGGFLAAWVIGYGIVQSAAPRILARIGQPGTEVTAARRWAAVLAAVSALISLLVALDIAVTATVMLGLAAFGAAFAVNSALHSYLVLAYADDDGVALDVGYYYSANAAGRLVGTLLSGLLYLWADVQGALWGTTAFLAITWLLTQQLPPVPESTRVSIADVDGGD